MTLIGPEVLTFGPYQLLEVTAMMTLAGSNSVIRISIKGNAEQAREALARRGLAGELVSEGRFGNTYWDVPEGVRPTLVDWFCEWFCEPSVADDLGFPVGTLLYHS